MTKPHVTSKNKDTACSLCCTTIQNFGVSHGGCDILKDVNMHIHCGELTAVIGPNGAGKSTLLKAIIGEIKHTGELSFLDAKGDHTGHPVIGYVPQHLTLDKATPASVLDFFGACKGGRPVWLLHSSSVRGAVIEALKRVQVEYLIDRRLGALSGGELQRVLLALALDPLPDILLLDEPISGVDHKGMEMFYHTVSELRKNYDLTIILVSHDLPLMAEYADRVVFLNKTVVTVGSPIQVFNHPEVLSTFGRIEVGHGNNGKGDLKS